MNTPAKMKALVLHGFGPEVQKNLRLEERPVLTPRAGEVLVKLAAAPIQPADLGFLFGAYAQQPLPIVAGFEGAGQVVAAGESAAARALSGKRVAVFAVQGGGTWAEYTTVPASHAFVLPDALDDLQGAMGAINPLTAHCLVARARQAGSKTLVQNAAGSRLAPMVRKLARAAGLEVIDIVRRPEQAEELRRAGCKHVLCSSDATHEAELRRTATELGATIAFDAVAGDATGALLSAMPPGSTVVVYGFLSLKQPVVQAQPLVFGDVRLEGFWLVTWLARASPAAIAAAWADGSSLAAELRDAVGPTFALEALGAALGHAFRMATGGKALFRF